jgi:hypothetical protein
MKAHKKAASLLPSLDHHWAAWPSILIGYGLGKELGAVPINGLGKGFSVNGKVAKPLIGQECPGDLQGSPPTWPTNGGLPSNNTLHDSKAM